MAEVLRNPGILQRIGTRLLDVASGSSYQGSIIVPNNQLEIVREHIENIEKLDNGRYVGGAHWSLSFRRTRLILERLNPYVNYESQEDGTIALVSKSGYSVATLSGEESTQFQLWKLSPEAARINFRLGHRGIIPISKSRNT